MPKIKICGLKRACDVEYANLLDLDYIGFIVNVATSKRSVDISTLCDLSTRYTGTGKKVGVFVNEKIELILSLVSEKYIDIIQLHGDEDILYLEKIKAKTKAPIIQAIKMQSLADGKKIEESIADYILLDNKFAGSGQSFDWQLIPSISKPFFLAGGIGLHNLEQALQTVKPYAVDISSGAEVNGVKDFSIMQKLVQCVRSNTYE